jgi:hypothetical protein
LDFKLLVYKGFLAMIFGISFEQHFRGDPHKVPVSLGFLQFRSRLGPHFKWDFGADFGHPLLWYGRV